MAEIVSFPTRPDSNTQAQAARNLVRSTGLTGLVRTATTAAPSSRRKPDSQDARGPAQPRKTAQRGGPESPDDSRGAAVIPLVAGSLARSLPEREPISERERIPEHELIPEPGGFAFLGEPDRILPVLPQLRDLVPSRGLRRGSTIGAMGSPGATSLVIALLAEASRSGSWCAVVGLPTFGAAAASEAGVALDRLALVSHPGPEWATIVAALLDGFDIVVAAPPGPVTANIAGRLSARARQRGSVLITYGKMPGADLVLESTDGRWHGLNEGAGRFLRRELTIEVRGRGSAARPQVATVAMPAYAPINHDWAPRTVSLRSDSGRFQPTRGPNSSEGSRALSTA